MNEQEKAFWETWDKIEEHYQSYNHRQMFDFGYRAAEQRIIELLEDLKTRMENLSGKDWQGKMAGRVKTLGFVIDYIKGENK